MNTGGPFLHPAHMVVDALAVTNKKPGSFRLPGFFTSGGAGGQFIDFETIPFASLKNSS